MQNISVFFTDTFQIHQYCIYLHISRIQPRQNGMNDVSDVIHALRKVSQGKVPYPPGLTPYQSQAGKGTSLTHLKQSLNDIRDVFTGGTVGYGTSQIKSL